MADLDSLQISGQNVVTADYKPVPAYEAGGGTLPETPLRGVVRQADDTPTVLGEMNERLAALASRDEWLKAAVDAARNEGCLGFLAGDVAMSAGFQTAGVQAGRISFANPRSLSRGINFDGDGYATINRTGWYLVVANARVGNVVAQQQSGEVFVIVTNGQWGPGDWGDGVKLFENINSTFNIGAGQEITINFTYQLHYFVTGAKIAMAGRCTSGLKFIAGNGDFDDTYLSIMEIASW